MEVEVPSVHESGRLPVLYLGLFVANNKIRSGFYSKPMASPYQIHYRSAISSRVKRDALLQEGLRRYRNMDSSISQIEKQTTVSKFMNSLKILG